MTITREPRRPGQESVWDYPRPPRLERSTRHVTVSAADAVVADSRRAWRVLETSHPPGWYVPRSDVDASTITRSDARSTICEWKGVATYWDVRAAGRLLRAIAWSYEQPTDAYAEIAGALAFMPTRLVCTVDGERARAQAGGFYGGWITDDVVGPFKGGPGTIGW